ncbi:lytic transglycosylase domain-containing protein [Pandoraea sputorum]|uniref:Soluble lytic murein transglycosylase n=1 Tax=Pandoraea sputorum TaxID=93222 RepID=A0A5E5AUT3_9BURK|nr:transglycosylase SLT domain-containing protein [Pandoraea sputorum]VVE76867.1 Soluble lytic murein transglycosylase [Pandoraea sputorum]
MSGRPTNRGRQRWRHVLLMSGALWLGGLPSLAADRGLLPQHPRVTDAQIAVPTAGRVANRSGGTGGSSVGLREARETSGAPDAITATTATDAVSTHDAARRLVSSLREAPAPTPPSIASARTGRNPEADPSVVPGLGNRPDLAGPATLASRAPINPGAAAPANLPFDALVRRAAQATSVDAALLHAIIDTESGYDPQAVSERGAIGLMQILPRTGQRFGVRRLEDPAENLRAGASYLRWLLSRFDDDVSLALAAYNAGEGAVLRYGRQVPPFPETQNYVRKVMASYSRLRGPAGADAIVPPLASRGAASPSAAQALVQTDGLGRNDMRDTIANVRKMAKTGSADRSERSDRSDRSDRADVPDDKNARAWRLLQGLGELITRSPSADAARRAGKADARRRDQPAVVMPSRMRERTAGAALRPAGHGDG